jgi:hypothetical protein
MGVMRQKPRLAAAARCSKAASGNVPQYAFIGAEC